MAIHFARRSARTLRVGPRALHGGHREAVPCHVGLVAGNGVAPREHGLYNGLLVARRERCVMSPPPNIWCVAIVCFTHCERGFRLLSPFVCKWLIHQGLHSLEVYDLVKRYARGPVAEHVFCDRLLDART